MAPEIEKSPLDYPRRVFDGVVNWYHNADSKAQIILTIDGIFVAFLTNSIFIEQPKLIDIIRVFGVETWVMLCLMCIALCSSILSAIKCLWSRFHTSKEIAGMFENIDVSDSKSYSPEVMLFFQFLIKLDAKELANKFSKVDQYFEIAAISHELPLLSKNVMKKHKWINRGFVLAAISLILFLLVAVSYVIRLTVLNYEMMYV